MRTRSSATIPAQIIAVLCLSACASVDLDPGGPDPALIRYVRVVEAQSDHDHAAAACRSAGPADPACRQRDVIAAGLRRQGYCRQAGDPDARDPADRYDLWVACGPRPDRAYARLPTRGEVHAASPAASAEAPSDR